jgi:hypothetical protein
MPLSENPTVTYLFEGDFLPNPLNMMDFVVLSLIFMAMRTKRDLHIVGTVSKKLLANMEEFQRIWNKWRPNKYHIVNITCDDEREIYDINDDTAVVAYSGGVDANFSLAAHCSKMIGRRAKEIRAAALVHGFDIPLNNEELFDASASTAKEILSTFLVPLTVIKTNWRNVICNDWEMEFGAGLAACLFQFSGQASIGIVGSDEDYSSRDFIWGSNPISNPYLSGGNFFIETDGSGFTRTEKVGFIAKFESIKNNLRVCWEGTDRTSNKKNCGHCEKCIRTKLNFYANGQEPGTSLSGKPTLNEILFINARNVVQIAYLQDILSVATARNDKGIWVKALKIAIFRSSLRLFMRSVIKKFIYLPLKSLLKCRK